MLSWLRLFHLKMFDTESATIFSFKNVWYWVSYENVGYLSNFENIVYCLTWKSLSFLFKKDPDFSLSVKYHNLFKFIRFFEFKAPEYLFHLIASLLFLFKEFRCLVECKMSTICLSFNILIVFRHKNELVFEYLLVCFCFLLLFWENLLAVQLNYFF